jgi:hypothetical protein
MLKCSKAFKGPKLSVGQKYVLVANMNLAFTDRSRTPQKRVFSLGTLEIPFAEWIWSRLWSLKFSGAEKTITSYYSFCLWSGSYGKYNPLNAKKEQDHRQSAQPSIDWWNYLLKLDPWIWRAMRGLEVIESQQNQIWNVHGEYFR